METHCAYCCFQVSSQRGNWLKELNTHIQYCTKHAACKSTHTHTHTYTSSTSRGTKSLYPLKLESAKRLEDDVLNNLITPNKKDAASFNFKKKKGVSHLTQKGFVKASTSAQQNSEQLRQIARKLRECHKELLHFFSYACLIGQKPNVYIPSVQETERFAL